MLSDERRKRRMVWFGGQYVPILYASRKEDLPGSKQWIARGTAQRLGASFFATIFFFGSVLVLVMSPLVRDQALEDVGGILGQIYGFVLSGLMVLIACAMIFAAYRLAKGIVRSFRKPATNSRLPG